MSTADQGIERIGVEESSIQWALFFSTFQVQVFARKNLNLE